jgi:hypothetical protein
MPTFCRDADRRNELHIGKGCAAAWGWTFEPTSDVHATYDGLMYDEQH